MMTKLILPFIFLLTCSCFLATAQDIDHPLTLSDLIDIALENHPETKQFWWNTRRAAAAVGSAQSAYYPKIDLSANINNGRDFKFINGPDTSYTIVGADLILSMLLFDFGGRSANINATKMALASANWQLDRGVQNVMVRVLENGYSTLHAQEVYKAALITKEEAEKMHNMALELNRAGHTAITDVYTTQATLSQMKMEVIQKRAALDIQKGKLAVSLGFSSDIVVELIPIQELSVFEKQQLSELIQLANQQRADLKSKQARVSEALFRQDKIRSSYQPKLSLACRGGSNHALHDKTKGAQYRVALNLDVPLFQGFESLYQNRQAFADTQISKEELAQLELDISLEVLTYSRSLEAAQEMLQHAEDNLNNSLRAYEGVFEKYRVGKESIAEVSNSQRQLAAARVILSDVKTRFLVSGANLAYATGILAPYMERSCEKDR